MGEADCSAVVGHNIRNFVFAKHLSLDFAQLETSLLGVNLDRLEAALDVVEDTEMLSSLHDGDHVHSTEREPGVASDLVVNFDIARPVSADFDALLAGEGELQSVAEEYGQWDALSQFVRAGRWAIRVHTLQFVQTPVRRCPHALHMLLWSSSLKSREQKWLEPRIKKLRHA